MKAYKAIVVGGGGLGLFIARQLVHAGIRPVALIERHLLASGFTQKSGGALRIFQDHPSLSEIALEGLADFLQMNQMNQTGAGAGENPFFTPTGALTFLSKSQLHKARQEIRLLQKRGAQIELLSAKTLKTALPHLQCGSGDYAVFEPQSGLLNCQELSRHLALEAEKEGLEIFEHLKVAGFIQDRYRISGVVTDQGRFHSPLTIVTAGAQTLALLNSIGVTVAQSSLPFLLNEYAVEEDVPVTPVVFERRYEHSAKFEKISKKLTRLSLLTPSAEPYFQCGETVTAETPAAKLALKRLSANFPFVQRARWISGSCIYDLERKEEFGTLGFVPGYAGLYSVFGWGGSSLGMAPALARQVVRQVQKSFRRNELPVIHPAQTITHVS